MKEIWKDIIGYEGLYKISNKGIVMGHPRTFVRSNGVSIALPERVIKSSDNGNGYVTYSLNLGNKNIRTFYAHRLVAIHFLSKIDGKDYVNHKDGNKLNNSVENLEWVTASENMAHAVKTGLQTRIGANHSYSKLVLDTSTGIFFDTLSAASNAYGIKKTTLSAMLIGQNRNRTNLIYV